MQNQRSSRSGLSKILHWDPWMKNSRNKKKEKNFRNNMKNQAAVSWVKFICLKFLSTSYNNKEESGLILKTIFDIAGRNK